MGSTESVSEVVVGPASFEQTLAALRHQRVNVGHDGFVMLVDVMGAEDAIVQAARVSYGDGTKSVSDDRTLVRYLLRHRHCYHPDMQVLTAAGWKAWRDCADVETFLVPDPATRTLRREHLAVEAFDASETMQTFRSERMSYCVTSDHRMWFKGKYAHEFEIVRAAKMLRWGHFDTQAGYRAAGCDAACVPDPLGQLVGFTLGDGSWSGTGLTFHLRKPRKKAYLRGVLEKLAIAATESQSSTYDDATVFYIGADAVRASGILAWMDVGQRASDKRLRDIPTEPAMLVGVLSGLAGSDGHCNETRNNRIEFSSVSSQLLRDFETVAALCGYDCHAVGRADRVTAYPAGRTTLEARKQYFGTQHYDGKVYCATTSTGLLLVRGGPAEFGFVCGNTTPFEMCELKFCVRVPMDVWRQWIRHRTASVNEYSTRYSNAIDVAALTKPDEWRLQATDNKQGSGSVLTEWPTGYGVWPIADDGEWLLSGLIADYAAAGHQNWAVVQFGTDDDGSPNGIPTTSIGEYYGISKADLTPGKFLSTQEINELEANREVYQTRLRLGVAREQARKDLPLSTYTEAYWKIDLHNLLHFLSLRMDSHAQLEIRQFAHAIYDIVKQLYPNVAEAFEDYRLDAVTLTGPELRLLPRVLDWVRQVAMTGVPADRPTSAALPAPLAPVTATDLWRFVASFATICPDEWRDAKKLPREVTEFHGKLVKMHLVAA
jgi:thymidylate synthase ThyX